MKFAHESAIRSPELVTRMKTLQDLIIMINSCLLLTQVWVMLWEKHLVRTLVYANRVITISFIVMNAEAHEEFLAILEEIVQLHI